MKKILSVLLALLILLPLSVGVFAAETAYITDALGRVEENTLKQLDEDAAKLKKTYGISIFLAYVQGHADDADITAIVGEETDYVLLLLGERGTRILTEGKAKEIFAASEDRDRLGYVHDEQDEWSDGIARYLEVVEEYLEDAKSEETGSTETVGAIDSEEETKIDEGGKEDEGFSPAFLIPVFAAVIAAGLAVVVVLRKKKA